MNAMYARDCDLGVGEWCLGCWVCVSVCFEQTKVKDGWVGMNIRG